MWRVYGPQVFWESMMFGCPLSQLGLLTVEWVHFTSQSVLMSVLPCDFPFFIYTSIAILARVATHVTKCDDVDCICEPNELVCECYILVSSRGGSWKRERQHHLTMHTIPFASLPIFGEASPFYCSTNKQTDSGVLKIRFCF